MKHKARRDLIGLSFTNDICNSPRVSLHQLDRHSGLLGLVMSDAKDFRIGIQADHTGLRALTLKEDRQRSRATPEIEDGVLRSGRDRRDKQSAPRRLARHERNRKIVGPGQALVPKRGNEIVFVAHGLPWCPAFLDNKFGYGRWPPQRIWESLHVYGGSVCVSIKIRAAPVCS